MKCAACGYEYVDNWNREDDYKGGHDEFICVQGNFFYKPFYSFDEKRVNIYACPNCGTLKVDL